MSWDVLLIKTETNGEPIEDISSPIPFGKESFIKLVKANFPDTDCRDETWLILNRERYSIEFIAAGINNRKTPYPFRLCMQAKMHLPDSRYFFLLL